MNRKVHHDGAAVVPLLTPPHLEHLRRFKIPHEILEAAGVRSVTDAEAREKFGIRFDGNLDGMAFPYVLNGRRVTCRLRRDHPEKDADGKDKNKYVSAYGDSRHCYLPPNYAERLVDPSIPLLYVEAEKSVLAIDAWAQRVGKKILPIATGGCWGWRGRIGIKPNANGEREEEKGVLPEVAFASTGRTAGILFDANARTNLKVQQARSAFEAQLRKQGATVLALELPVVEGVNGVDDFIAVAGDQAFSDLLSGKSAPVNTVHVEPSAQQTPGRILVTETSNAERLIARYAQDVRFASDRGVWCVWNGQFWAVDDVGAVMRLMREISREIYFEAGREPDGKIRKALAAWAQESESRRTQENSASLARYFAGVEIREFANVFDSHAFLLNVKNGTIDLKSGEIRPHRREDFLTKQVPIAYDPAATCRKFNEFLNQSLPQPGMAGYMARLLGYVLTGCMAEQKWWLLHGLTGSGKSTLVRILLGILGPYGMALPPDFFLAKDSTDYMTANLVGMRLAASVETPEGKALDTARIKAITGEDRLSAQLKYQNFFQFAPQAKLLLATNYRPRVAAGDAAIWRRTRLIPFQFAVPENKQNARLTEELISEEATGILRLAVIGCIAWQNGGLDEPAAVRDASEAYRAAEDIVADFLRQCATKDADSRSLRADVYRAYSRWALGSGMRPISAKKLATELVRLGIEGDPGDRFWLGIRISQEFLL